MSGVKKKAQEEIVKDPVCKMEKPISKMRAKLTYKGKTYYFCTEGDKGMFEAFPDNWIPAGDRDDGLKK